jgi:hypothetical protein
MTPVFNNLRAIAQFAAAHMLQGIVEGTALAMFAWMLFRIMGRQSSGVRFAMWFSVLLAVAGWPFLGTLHSGNGLAVPQPTGSAITVPGSWALYAFGLWAAISGVAIGHLGFGLYQLGRLRRNSTPVAIDGLDSLLRGCLEETRKSRPVELRTSGQVHVPTAIGFFRPTIILPEWVLGELSVEEVHTVLLHELAHLKRRDDWTNLVQKLLRAVFFFHPAVWWIESKLSLEREMACDDMVLARTANPRAYAQCLVSMAEKNLLHRGFALAQAAVSRMRHMTVRVTQILRGKRPRTTQVWKPVLSLASLLAVAGLIAPHTPRLIAFESSQPEVQSIAQADLQGSTLKPAATQSGETALQDAPQAHLVQAGLRTTVVAPALPKAKLAQPRMAPSRQLEARAEPQPGSGADPALIDEPTTDQALIRQASAVSENPAPAVREAVFVVVQTREDVSGFSRGWDVYVIRMTFSSQNPSPGVTPTAVPVDKGVSAKT